MTPDTAARKSARLLLLAVSVIVLPCTLHGSTKGSSFQSPESLPQGAQSVDGLIAALQKNDVFEKQRAAISLGNAGDARAVQPLIQALQDEDDFVRIFSAKALGNLRDPRAVAPLIQALGDRHMLVRRAAAQALGSIGDASAVDPLLEILEKGTVLVQRAAAEALAELKEPRALDPLIQALGSDDNYVRGYAAEALATIGPSAVPKLVAQLGDSKMGPRAAEILKDLHWQPSSAQEKARYDGALGTKEPPSNN